MLNNTAAAGQGFWDGWDDEEPTVVDRWARLPGKGNQYRLNTTRDAYAALTDTGIRAAFRADPGATCQDLTAVTS